jgi:hypothetical protein
MAEPPVRIVSSQSEEEVSRLKAADELKRSLRILAANILRIVRGSGSPDDLSVWQIADCAEAFQSYLSVVGRYPDGHEIRNILDCELAQHEYRPWIQENSLQESVEVDDYKALNILKNEAMIKIRQGALQVAASMLLDQMTQQNKGRQEIHEAIRALNKFRADTKKLMR